MISAFAEFERDIISERVKAGLSRAKSEGKKLGRDCQTKPLKELESLSKLVLIGADRSELHLPLYSGRITHRFYALPASA